MSSKRFIMLTDLDIELEPSKILINSSSTSYPQVIFGDIPIDISTFNLTNDSIIDTIAVLCKNESYSLYQDRIISLMNMYDMSIEVMPIHMEILSLRDKFSIESLKVFYSITNFSYDILIHDIIKYYGHSQFAGVYLYTLDKIFGPPNQHDYINSLLIYVTDMNTGTDYPGMIYIQEYLEKHYVTISPFAQIPTYIHQYDIDVDNLPKLTEIDLPNLSDQTIVDLIMNNPNNEIIINDNITDDVKELLLKYVKQMPLEQRENYLKDRIDPTQLIDIRKNITLFRSYGPVNSFNDMDFSTLLDDNGQDDIDKIYGGARMFLDMSLEVDDETGEVLNDWFTGFCNNCLSRIRTYHHAVRQPRITGGWLGCFCSFKCLREWIFLDIESQNEIIIDEKTNEQTLNEDDKITAELRLGIVKIMEQDMIKHGICDRSYDDSSIGLLSDDPLIGLLSDDPINQPDFNTIPMNFQQK